jgi:site-specific DNA recombinase
MKNAMKKLSKKAVCYIRTSTGKQDLSVEVQTERLDAYCRMNGLDVVAVFTESDVTATKSLAARPGGAKMLKLLADGTAHIVALKLDRLFRNASDALNHVENWNSEGISLHLVDMGGMSINTGSSMGKMMFTMLAGFAEFERNMIAERTSAALQHKKATGRVFSHAPYGFDAKNGMLVANPTEQKTLTEIKAMRAQGISYNRIANELNATSTPAKRGAQWHSQSVKTILETAA